MKIDNPNRLFPIQKKDRYFNGHHDHVESLIFQTIPSFLLSLYGRKKRQPENKLDWIAQDTPLATSQEPVITWIGHATFLVQVNGVNILTDPIFGNASAFFPRLLPPGIALVHLPRIDVVLLSHNHRDHCDLPSLHAVQKAHPNVRLLVAAGDKKWLAKKGFAHVEEFHWWQSYEFNSVEFTFLPAHHWSAQGVFDRNRSLWGSWMIQSKLVGLAKEPFAPIEITDRVEGSERSYPSNRTVCSIGTNGKIEGCSSIYFAGDTSYSPHFTHIAQEFPHIDVALMPIAPEFPHPTMRKSHIDSHEAVQGFIDLKANTFVPMHWGTFPFGSDTFLGPIERLQEKWRTQELHVHKNLIIPKVGQRIHLS